MKGEMERMREALFRIAFQHDTNPLGGDPSKWPSIIAYRALGGRIADGQHKDTEAELRASIAAKEG